MYLNAFRIRLSLIGAGVLVMLVYLIAGGSLNPHSKAVILIDYTMYADDFDGREVLIDGEIAGTLRRFGGAFKTGFEVETGDHSVQIIHPAYRCPAKRVTTGPGGWTVHLIPDFASTRGPDGESETIIVFQM
jgi:hypothetical protein